MCVTPRFLTLESGMTVEVACRNCWQCCENKINDWVGRCIAEEQDAVHTTVYTLTYGGDDKVTGVPTELGASILIYSDVQKWLKRLRFAGYPLRFLLCGENGSLKGRVHWHVICFWQDKVPDYKNGIRNFNDPFWHHGFTMAEDLYEPKEKAIRYVCKYLQKSEGNSSFLRMSKKPPLGDGYFRRRAETFASQGILPKDAFYSFADVRDKDDMPVKYMMSGVTLDNFMETFINAWKKRYGIHPLDVQHSDFLLEWLDGVAPRVSGDSLEGRVFAPAPVEPPHFAYSVSFNEKLNTYVAVCDSDVMFWCKVQGVWIWSDFFVAAGSSPLVPRLVVEKTERKLIQ
ncbi:MAG: replication initiator protein [Microviridae sp.]|nr:MAG: replication initiator protein [Microviridae sp.]